jgi:hypothetical protein
MYKRISIISKQNLGKQIIKHSLTSTEKKILLFMLNGGMNAGTVKNKHFSIDKLNKDTANIVIRTTTKSIILGKNETTRYSLQIKFN